MQTNTTKGTKMMKNNNKFGIRGETKKMSTNLESIESRPDSQAQVLVPTRDVGKDIDFFKETFGFKLLNIFPDDNPEFAILFGHGIHLRLDRKFGELQVLNASNEICGIQNKSGCVIILLTDDVKMLELMEDELRSPGGGAIVRVQARSYNIPNIEPMRENLKYFDVEIECTSEDQLSNPSSNVWVVGRAGMLYRNILSSRLGGLMSAEHIWIPKGGPVPDNVHFHTIRFQLIYCYTGWVKLVYEDQGDAFILNAGDCVTQPPEIRHRVLECSDNLQVIEIGIPSTHMTSLDHDMVLPTNAYNPEREWEGQKFCHFKANEVTWKADTGVLECKDTGVFEKTNGFVSVKIFRIKDFALDHHDPDCFSIDGHVVFTFVLEGSMKLVIAGKEPYILKKGNSYMIPGHKFYQFKDWTHNLELLQVAVTGLILKEDGNE